MDSQPPSKTQGLLVACKDGQSLVESRQPAGWGKAETEKCGVASEDWLWANSQPGLPTSLICSEVNRSLCGVPMKSVLLLLPRRYGAPQICSFLFSARLPLALCSVCRIPSCLARSILPSLLEAGVLPVPLPSGSFSHQCAASVSSPCYQCCRATTSQSLLVPMRRIVYIHLLRKGQESDHKL